MTDPKDEVLRARIVRADPARSLAPAGDDELRRLREAAMSDTTTTPASAPVLQSRRRGLLIAGFGAAAMAVAATAIVLPLVLTPAGKTTELALPAGGGFADMCAPVSADVIGQAQTAFRGTVTSIADGTVTLRVDDRFAGDPGTTVEIAQGADTVTDGAPIVFDPEGVYLIAAVDGVVLTCGNSGPDSPELTTIYDDAFGR